MQQHVFKVNFTQYMLCLEYTDVKDDLLEYKCLCDCNLTGTHNHLVHKRALNHLAKLA